MPLYVGKVTLDSTEYEWVYEGDFPIGGNVETLEGDTAIARIHEMYGDQAHLVLSPSETTGEEVVLIGPDAGKKLKDLPGNQGQGQGNN